MRKQFIAFAICALSSSISFASVELPKCAYDAAEKYGAPKKVFEALILAERDSPNLKDSKHYGSMNMYELIIPELSQKTTITEDKIKNDECSGYYAASWLLMNPVNGDNSDIWSAVYSYYYGATDRYQSNPVKVDQVRKIYETL